MARPDYALYGALVVKGVLTYHEAQMLCGDQTSEHEYDRPVLISLETGLDRAIDLLTEANDDEAIDDMLHRHDDVEIELDPECEHCDECGAELTEENRLTDEMIDDALGLYFHLQEIFASFCR